MNVRSRRLSLALLFGSGSVAVPPSSLVRGSTLLILGDSVDFGIAAQQCHEGGYRVATCKGQFSRLPRAPPSRCLQCWAEGEPLPLSIMWMIYGASLHPPLFPAATLTHAIADVVPDALKRIDQLLGLTFARFGTSVFRAAWLSANLWDVARMIYPANAALFPVRGLFLRKHTRESGLLARAGVRDWLAEWRANVTAITLHLQARLAAAAGRRVPIVWKSAPLPAHSSQFKGWNVPATALLNREAAAALPPLGVAFANVAACCRAAAGGCANEPAPGAHAAFIGKSLDGLHPSAEAARVMYLCVDAALATASAERSKLRR